MVLAFVVAILDGCVRRLMRFLDGPLLERLPLLLLGNGAAFLVNGGLRAHWSGIASGLGTRSAGV